MSLCQVDYLQPHNFLELMFSRKRTYSSRTGPASYKRAKTASAKSIQKASTVAAPKRKRIELKRGYAGVVSAIGTLTQAPVVNWLPLIQAGQESDERDGRAIQIKGWEVRGAVWGSPGGAFPGSGLIRVIVGRWKQAQNGSPSANDILRDIGSGIPLHHSYNIEQAANYEILQDRVYNCNPKTLAPSGTSYDANTQYVHLYGKVDFEQTYAGNLQNTLADQALFIMVMSEGVDCSAELYASVSFIDI